MIISRTPYRISFFGGGTDYPPWYREHGGAVLATSIDKYCYLSCRYLPPFFEHRFRAVYSKIENAVEVDEIQHPAIREVLRYLDWDRGLEIHHDGDLPARSGMGSSSSFTVGLLHALYALRGQMPSRRQLALEAIQVEQELIRETVGSQDQVTAAHGGFNLIQFGTTGEISVQPVLVSPERIRELNAQLMLFYTGIVRTASDVAGTFVAAIGEKRRQLRVMRDLVDEALSVLGSGRDLRPFGELLHEAWELKRGLSRHVTNDRVDEQYQAAREAGAVGGKITGAGGGGFMLLFVPRERQRAVRERLGRLLSVPFRFESAGSQIIFVDHEEDYAALDEHRKAQAIDAFTELALEPSR